ncbi:hypothetical protein [Streptomyces sp. enrichment culture]|uniref:hypothetical protein n=1 Tax=Streptomyces sp. enrichment culture TaxID=1795815 RepID=UPI003F57AEC8
MTTRADPVPGGRPGDVERATALSGELGRHEVDRRFPTASGTAVFCVDTGYAPERFTGPAHLAATAGARAHEVVRPEGVAEPVAAAGVEAGGYADAFRAAAPDAVGRPGVVGVKSVAAYRTGFGDNDLRGVRLPPRAGRAAPGPGGRRRDEPGGRRACRAVGGSAQRPPGLPPFRRLLKV